MSDSERGLVRKLTKSEVFKSKETASFMDSLSHDSLSANKMAALRKNIGCEEAILRTAFHAAVGDLRLTAMAAVARAGKEVNLDEVTLGVQPNDKALALKRLALIEMSSEEESEEEEEEEQKKEEEKIDTDDENLMFSDDDCAQLTESEEDSEDSANEEMLELGRQMYEQMQAAAAAGGPIPEGLTLPPVDAPRRAL